MFGGPGHGGPGNGGHNPLEAFQMFFGGQSGAGRNAGMNGVDPRIIEQMFAGGGFHGFPGGFPGDFPGAQAQQQQAGQQGANKAHATAAATLRNLPKIKVTDYDIQVNESTECSICLDDLVVGQPALRIHCGHLYHEDCVKDWLKKSNECPVCRYELPTDDKEYEKERARKMAGRKIRMKRGDLTRKTAQELRRLAEHIGVDVRGCLEKGEFVERIASSSKVEILPDAGDVPDAAASAASSSTATGLLIYSQSELDSMSIEEMQALVLSMGIDLPDTGDKQELIRRLADGGRLVVTSDGSSPPTSPTFGQAPAPVGGDAAPADPANAAPLAERSVKELRQLAARLGVSLGGCLEKSDMVQRIEAAQRR